MPLVLSFLELARRRQRSVLVALILRHLVLPLVCWQVSDIILVLWVTQGKLSVLRVFLAQQPGKRRAVLPLQVITQIYPGRVVTPSVPQAHLLPRVQVPAALAILDTIPVPVVLRAHALFALWDFTHPRWVKHLARFAPRGI